MKKQTLPTMRDVAQHAQVSIATVSRVINSPHLTSIATQLRVHQAIEQLQYDISALFKSLPRQQSSKKLLVIDNQLRYHSPINRGIEAQAIQLGYKLLYLRLLHFSQLDVQQIIRYSLHQQIAGILIINGATYLPQLYKNRQLLPPILLVNQHSTTLPSISFDHLAITYQGINHLLEHGHKRIVCLTCSNHKASYLQIKAGLQQALQRFGLSYSPHALLSHCYDFNSSAKVVQQLMSRPNPPTAIFCYDNFCLDLEDQAYCNNHLTSAARHSSWSSIDGILSQLRKMQIDVPQQLSLLYTQADCAPEVSNYLPLSYIAKPMFFMGISAVNQLITEIKQPSSKIEPLLLEAPLLHRHSVSKNSL